jgi:predicted DNA-binding protein
MAEDAERTSNLMAEGPIAMTIRLPADLYERLRKKAFDTRRKQIEIVREALERYLGGEHATVE